MFNDSITEESPVHSLTAPDLCDDSSKDSVDSGVEVDIEHTTPSAEIKKPLNFAGLFSAAKKDNMVVESPKLRRNLFTPKCASPDLNTNISPVQMLGHHSVRRHGAKARRLGLKRRLYGDDLSQDSSPVEKKIRVEKAQVQDIIKTALNQERKQEGY